MDNCNCLDLDEVSYRSIQDDDLEFVLHALVDGSKNLMNPKQVKSVPENILMELAVAEFKMYHDRAKSPDFATLAIHDGRRIGFVWATLETASLSGNPGVKLRNVYILPELCGQGVAKVLIRMAEEWAAEHGAAEIRREIWSKNKKGKDLYKFLEYKPQIIQVSKKLI